MKKCFVSLAAFVLAFATPGFASLKDGLVAYWSFDATNAVDNSGNGHDGTISGWPTPVAGISGNAYDFHGGSGSTSGHDWIGAAHSSAFDLTNNVTVGGWIKYNSISPGFGSQILWYGDATSGHDPWELHLLPDGTAQFRLDAGAGYTAIVVNSPTALSAGTWYFLVGTLSSVGDVKTLKLYIDGALSATVVTKLFTRYDISLSGMTAEIGAVDNGTWQFFNGVIDGPFVYRRALSASEVRQINASGIPKRTARARRKVF